MVQASLVAARGLRLNVSGARFTEPAMTHGNEHGEAHAVVHCHALNAQGE
jgi:hypothetical protein